MARSDVLVFAPYCAILTRILIVDGRFNLNTEIKWEELEFDLGSFCEAVGQILPVKTIYLFGSRNFKTGSVRSDIDLFFEVEGVIKPYEVRDLIDAHCKALDIFLLSRGEARSVINESFIQGDDNDYVLRQCGAIKLWSRDKGLVPDSNIPWKLGYASHIDFAKTMLPNAYIRMSIDDLKVKLQRDGLPLDPIIGETEIEVAERLVEIAERITKFQRSDFPNSSGARESFVVKPANEYDVQDLFWVACKPWVQSIAREKLAIVFDGQEKRADFSISGSRFILEMKFAKNPNDKRSIVKTLEGLSKFYSENANVKFLMFIIYARRAANIDSVLWETTFSRLADGPKVLVKVITLDD